MRRLLPVIAVLMWGAAGALRAEVQPSFAPLPGTLLLNSSFEHNVDSDSFPDHWSFVNYAPGGEIRWVAGDARDGRIGVRMSAPQGGQVILYPGAANQALPCVEGRAYVLSIYARSEGPAKTMLGMAGSFADGRYTPEIVGGWISPAGPTGWTRYLWKFTGPAGLRTMKPWISHQQGTMVVDCFQVEEGTEPSAYAPPQFARLYVEPAAARQVYPAQGPFTPEYTVYNDTDAPLATTLRVSYAEVWGPGRWQFSPAPVSLEPGHSVRLKLPGGPRDLPPGRYRLTLTGKDAAGELCCQRQVDQTLAGPPNGQIPRFPQPEPAITPQLQSVADGYSRLLVALSLLDDQRRQLARALFYAKRAGLADPDAPATEAVYQALAGAEATLAAAREKYNQAYGMSFELHRKAKPLTPEQTQQRDQIVAEIAQSLIALEGSLPALRASVDQRLTALTAALGPKIAPGFKPQVVGHPGQPQQGLTLDSTGHASGIIWGLCGHTDNVLRLQRWLGCGATLDGRPGMIAPGQVAQGPQTWFNTGEYVDYQREGLKYGANFYTGATRNAAATDYFLAAHAGDPDLLLQTSTGETPDKSALNIWLPAVQAQVRDFCTTQAGLLRQDPRALYSYYAWEPSFDLPGTKETGGVETGYNPTARADFRKYLQAKFSTIQKLNTSWGSSYASFGAIEPPPDGLVVPRTKATPLTYEFEVWRQKSYADYYKLCYDAIKAGDPDHPCGVSGSAALTLFNGPCYTDGVDSWQCLKRGADFFDAHSDLYLGVPQLVWEHSIARLLDKTQLLNESNWDFSAPSHKQDERQWQATGEMSLWRWMVWGRTYLNLFCTESEYVPPTEFYGQGLLEMNQDYTILREASKFMKIAMDKSSRYGDLLISTQIATPKVGLLESGTSVTDCFPTGSPVGGYPWSPPLHEAFNFSALLEPHNYDYLYVPEQAVLEDHHDLGQYRALVVPYATHFLAGLEEALLAYVRGGGWLICSGPPGVFDPYGRPDNRLLTALLGTCAPAYTSGGENSWVWALNPGQLRPEAHVELADDKGGPVIVSAPYGRGGILLSLASWRTDAAKQAFYRVLDAAIRNRTAWCESDKLELVTRTDRQGRRYLFVMNRSVDETTEDTVHVEGSFPHPVDLGVGRRFPLPAAVRQGFTVFSLRLERGDSTVIALQ